MASTYTFTVKAPASPTSGSKTQSHFQNQAVDGSRVAIQAVGNGIQTTDATATPVVSPVTATTKTLNVPESAIQVTLCSTAAFTVSEVSSGSPFTVPANTVITLGVANTSVLYLTQSSGSISFFFTIV